MKMFFIPTAILPYHAESLVFRFIDASQEDGSSNAALYNTAYFDKVPAVNRQLSYAAGEYRRVRSPLGNHAS